MALEPLQFIGICGVGVQRLVEALDPLLSWICGYIGAVWKKSGAIAISVAAGTFLSHALQAGYGGGTEGIRWSMAFVNGLLIGGGTETFNSMIKILSSAKQATERKAGDPKLSGDPHAIADQLPDPPSFALDDAPQ